MSTTQVCCNGKGSEGAGIYFVYIDLQVRSLCIILCHQVDVVILECRQTCDIYRACYTGLYCEASVPEDAADTARLKFFL